MSILPTVPFVLVATVFVSMPSSTAAQATGGQEGAVACNPEGDRAGLRGLVYDARTSVPLQDAEVQITWTAPEEQEPRQIELRTDLAGMFETCDLPSSRILRTVATFWGQSSRRIQTSGVDAGAIAEIELEVAAPTQRVNGSVVRDGSTLPIDAATVSLGYPLLTAVTAEDGSFTIAAAPAGRYRLQVDHVAFTAVSDSIEVRYGDRTIVSVRMATATLVMDPITVEVRSILLEESGFYDRKERGQGVYMTRSDIQERIPLYPSDALRGIAGVNAVASRDRPGNVLVDRNQCPYRYVFNGGIVGEGFQIDDIPVDWIEALEIYRGISTLPAEFEGAGMRAGGHCGVIVIWTRNVP